MKTHIALLRGINVSGQKKIKMADLRDLLVEKGFSNVRTYIQSGNILLISTQPSHIIKEEIQLSIKDQYGFDVHVVVRTPEQIKDIVNNNPFSQDNSKEQERTYYTILASEPTLALVNQLEAIDYKPEEVIVNSEVVYFYSPLGYGAAKMNNNFLEKKLKVVATTRNWKTMNKLIEMAEMR